MSEAQTEPQDDLLVRAAKERAVALIGRKWGISFAVEVKRDSQMRRWFRCEMKREGMVANSGWRPIANDTVDIAFSGIWAMVRAMSVPG